MDVALCLSGLTRSISYSWPFLERYLVRPFSSKVFIHTWDIDHGGERGYKNPPLPSFFDGCTKAQFFEKEIKPQAYTIESYVNWCAQSHSEKASTAMFYSIYQANCLKIQYEKENGVIFDIVIRARMDLFFEKFLCPMEIQEALKNRVVYGGHAGGKPDPRFITDVFGFSNSKVMDIYSGVWENIVAQKPRRYPAELELHEQLINNNIEFKWSKSRFRILNEWSNRAIEIVGFSPFSGGFDD